MSFIFRFFFFFAVHNRHPPAQVSKKSADKRKLSSQKEYQARTKCHGTPWRPSCEKYLLISSGYRRVYAAFNLFTGGKGTLKDSRLTPQCREHVVMSSRSDCSLFGLRQSAQISAGSGLAKERN